MGDPASLRALDHLLGIGEYADEKNLLLVQEGQNGREGEMEEEEDIDLACELCGNPPDTKVRRYLSPPFILPEILTLH